MLKTDSKKVKLILDWCIENFGYSKYERNVPRLLVRKKGKLNYGQYCSNKNLITIRLEIHKSLLELCNTILHEYKHYKLSSNKYTEIYLKLKAKGFSHYEIHQHHLHEQLCDAFASEWENQCFNNLKKQLKSRKKCV